MTFSRANLVPKISKGAARHLRGWSRVGVLVLLLSVFFQGYVAATHIHRAGQSFTQVISDIVSPSAGEPQGSQAPAEDDNANCLLCQAVLQSGAFSAPALMAVLLPALLFIGLAAAASQRVAPPVRASHRWRSRAPPHS